MCQNEIQPCVAACLPNIPDPQRRRAQHDRRGLETLFTSRLGAGLKVLEVARTIYEVYTEDGSVSITSIVSSRILKPSPNPDSRKTLVVDILTRSLQIVVECYHVPYRCSCTNVLKLIPVTLQIKLPKLMKKRIDFRNLFF